MGWKYAYPHICLLSGMKPNKRVFLGKRIFWTEKEDGECVALWWNKNQYIPNSDPFIQISSRNMEDAAQDIKSRVMATDEYSKLEQLLKENPLFVVYVEECKKGRSVTGIKQYDKTQLFVIDIFDIGTQKYLPYVLMHQYAYHHGLPVVKLYAETRHRTMKDLLAFANHCLEYCDSVKQEGVVLKVYEDDGKYVEGGLLMAKVKLDVPEPQKVKIQKGEPIYPAIPENEIMGAISKVEADHGLTGQSKDDMPLIAQYVGEACKEHLYSKPKQSLFSYYQEYLSRRADK
jgi:hypothetical protein